MTATNTEALLFAIWLTLLSINVAVWIGVWKK